MQKYAKYIPTITIAVVATIGANQGAITGFIHTHPTVDVLLTAVAAILGHLSPSPLGGAGK